MIHCRSEIPSEDKVQVTRYSSLRCLFPYRLEGGCLECSCGISVYYAYIFFIHEKCVELNEVRLYIVLNLYFFPSLPVQKFKL